jgi:hypothetical protein
VGFWFVLGGVEASSRGTAGERCSAEMTLGRRSGPGGGCSRPVVSDASPMFVGLGSGFGSSCQVKPR